MPPDSAEIKPPEPRGRFGFLDKLRRSEEKPVKAEKETIKEKPEEVVQVQSEVTGGDHEVETSRVEGVREEIAEVTRAESEKDSSASAPGFKEACGFVSKEKAIEAYETELAKTLVGLKDKLTAGDYLKVGEKEDGTKIYDPIVVDPDISPESQQLETRMIGLGNVIGPQGVDESFLERLPRKLYSNLIAEALAELAKKQPNLMLFAGGKDDEISSFWLDFGTALVASANNINPGTNKPFLRFNPTLKFINISDLIDVFEKGGINILPGEDGEFQISIDFNNSAAQERLNKITTVKKAPDLKDKKRREALLGEYQKVAIKPQ